MNTRRSRSQSGLSTSRAHFSPVLQRSAQALVIRNRVQALLRDQGAEGVPPPDSLTPRTPAAVERFWDPHLVDRLQTRLTRFRD